MKKLENYSNTPPFKVPDNYFENFNIQIVDTLTHKQHPKNKWGLKKVMPWIVAAATFCGVIFSIGILDDQQVRKIHKDITDVTLYEDDYINYMEEQSTQSIYMDMFYDNNN